MRRGLRSRSIATGFSFVFAALVVSAFIHTANAQTAYCGWIDAKTGQPYPAGSLVPLGMKPINFEADPNHYTTPSGRNFVRDPSLGWIDAKTGQPYPAGSLVPLGMKPINFEADPNHYTTPSGRNFVRVPCPQPQTAQLGTTPAWTGWVGFNGGFAVGTGNFRETAGTGDFSTTGGTFGGTLGYGARIGRAKVGIESDLNWADFNGSSHTNCAVGCGVTNHWFATVRPLVGVQINDTGIIPYITGGLAVGNVTANVTGFSGVSQTNVGWTVGGGVAFPLGMWSGHRVVGKVEYLHLDLGSVQCMPATCGGTADVKSTQEVFRAGVNIAFQP
jgi:outer membrane immunogenic protein